MTNMLTSLSVVVNAGQKTAIRPLRIADGGVLCVNWKGAARPVDVTGVNTVAFDPTTAPKIDLGTTRAAKTTDLKAVPAASQPAPLAAAAMTTTASPSPAVEADLSAEDRVKRLTRGLRLQEAKVAKNPGDAKAVAALTTTRKRLAAAQAEMDGQPSAEAASVDQIADLAKASGLDIIALIGALSARL